MQTFVRVFASLWLTIPILVAIAVILILATTGIGLDLSIGAIRKDWYRAWWFQGLLGLLAVNLITCTLKRKPWQIWQWGFITTHWGILMIIVGAMVSGLFKIYGSMPIQKGGSLDYVQLEDERELAVEWLDTGERTVVPIDYNWYEETRPHERIALGPASLRISRFLPNVERMPPPRPVVELTIHAPGGAVPIEVPLGESLQIPGSPLTVDFRDVTEERIRELEAEGKEGGRLVLTFGEEKLVMAVSEYLGKSVSGPGGIPVRIVERIEEHPPGLRIEVDGEPYVIVGNRVTGEKEAPFAARYQVPPHGSLFMVLRTPEGWRYLMRTREGEQAVGELRFGERVRFIAPRMPMELEAHRYVPDPDIAVRRAEPEQNVALFPALEVLLEGEGKATGGWVLFTEDPEQDNARVFQVGSRSARLRFGPRRYTDLQMVVHLQDARQENHPGTSNAAKFESDVRVVDRRTGKTIEAKIGVNSPFTNRGYSFYMSGFNPVGPKSVFQVLYDPGTLIIYLGAIIAVSGTLFMFYLKPLILKSRGELQRLGIPLQGPTLLHYFGAIPVPVAVIFAHSVRSKNPRFAYRFGRAIAVTWILVTAALVCYLGLYVI